MNRQTDYENEQSKYPSGTTEEIDETPYAALERVYRKQLIETLQQAVRNGSDGIDVIHTQLQQQSENCGLDVWQATEWDTEPPSLRRDRCQRYDFRYYEREVLLDCLSRGVWPGKRERKLPLALHR